VRVYDSSPVRPMGNTGQTYFLTGAPIFRGEADIQGGTGILRFRVPSALRTGIRGPAGLYAYAAATDRDALGAKPALSVPEREAPAGTDRDGPRIAVHFSGDTAALSAEASFTADLYDSSGINITGLVPSRSVIMQIEEGGTLVTAIDVSDQVLVGTDYRSASLEERLPAGLVSGHAYDLVLRASDNLSNSGSVRIPFTIAGGSGGAFALSGVYNFPNPTDGGTRFFATVSGSVDLTISIFTIGGKRIWRTHASGVTPTQLAGEGISWDGRDADGDLPANGVYLFRLEARPGNGEPARAVTGRLVVSR